VGELRAQWLTPLGDDSDDEGHVRSGRRPLEIVHPQLIIDSPATYNNSGLLSFALLPSLVVNVKSAASLPSPTSATKIVTKTA
jgi:hypothetical protein